MRHAYIDPSAWVKRYYNEEGTDLTNYLFDKLLKLHPSPTLLFAHSGDLPIAMPACTNMMDMRLILVAG